MVDHMTSDLIDDFSTTSVEDLLEMPHAAKLTLIDVLPILASPDNGMRLSINATDDELSDGVNEYPLISGIPILYPKLISKAFLQEGLAFEYYKESKLQYFLLSQIKQRGEINAPSTSIYYQRHLFRMKNFLKDFGGTVLDIGCDNVNVGASLFPIGSNYIGIDPFSSETGQFKIVGVGEILPFASSSFDTVVFNTSLDHILDYNTALEEAYRVLKPGGMIVLSTLIWIEKASLLNDAIHFHHFRDFEILGALSQHGEQVSIKKYLYKEDAHRYGMYVAFRKRS